MYHSGLRMCTCEDKKLYTPTTCKVTMKRMPSLKMFIQAPRFLQFDQRLVDKEFVDNKGMSTMLVAQCDSFQ